MHSKNEFVSVFLEAWPSLTLQDSFHARRTSISERIERAAPIGFFDTNQVVGTVGNTAGFQNFPIALLDLLFGLLMFVRGHLVPGHKSSRSWNSKGPPVLGYMKEGKKDGPITIDKRNKSRFTETGSPHRYFLVQTKGSSMVLWLQTGYGKAHFSK